MNILYKYLYLLLLIPSVIFAQTTIPDPNAPMRLDGFQNPFAQADGTVNCFDYYSFGSVQAEFTPSVTQVVAGTKITFKGLLHNKNQYPVVNGSFIVKIFKTNESSEKNIFGPDVVDEFIVKKDVSLNASSAVPISFDWKVPSHAPSGTYKAVAFFTVADKFNLLGLTFTDDVIGNSANFAVLGENSDFIGFNKTKVFVDGNQYFFAAYPPRVSGTSSIPVEAELQNPTSQIKRVKVLWEVYSWDAQSEKNFLTSSTTFVTLQPKSSLKTSMAVWHTEKPVYYVRATALYEDSKSILGVRFVRRDINDARINFPSVQSFPLKKGEKNGLFSCLHSISDTAEAPSGTLKLTLTDLKDNVIHKYEYSGVITGNMMGVQEAFTPEKDFDNVKLKAELISNGKTVDSSELIYMCENINPKDCKSNTKTIALIAVVLFAIIAAFIFRKKYKKEIITIFLCSIFFGPHMTFAKDVQWNQTVNRGFSYYFDSTATPDITTPFWHIGLLSPNITVRYSAQVTNADTGAVIADGSNVSPGTKLNFTFSPHTSSDIYWFGTGFSTDSPYGEWGSITTPPAITCQTKDFVNYDTSPPPLNFAIYIPLVIAPPTKSLTNTSGMTCVDLNSTTKQCTVTGTGALNPTFQFDQTSGKFFYRLKGTNYYGGRCIGTNVPMEVITSTTGHEPYTLSVPGQSITYNLVSVSNSQPPTAPVITGPTTGYVNEVYTFNFKSTDPDNDQVRYGIDWSGGNTVNEWVPGSGYVPDETDQTSTKSWTTPGTYTFKIKAQDNQGADSGWTTHTIVISNNPDHCTNISGSQASALFQAHGRDYFQSLDDGKLYFVPSSASSPQVCAVDMCADTSAIEEDIPAGYVWNPSGVTAYQQYSCVLDTPEVCSCSGRTYNCSDNGVQTSSTPNAPQCALTASCSYAQPTGNQVTFNYTATNVLGSLINGGSQAFTIPTTGQGTISDSRVLSNTGDGQTSTAACSYNYVSTDPKIVSFVASKVVAQGSQCTFTWQTADMTACTLSGESVSLTGNRSYSTSAGKNITKTLSCTTNEQVPQTVAMTRTCFVKPEVEER